MKFILVLILSGMSWAAWAAEGAGGPCQKEAEEMAAQLDEITQEFYQGEEAFFETRLLSKGEPMTNRRAFKWEVTWVHENEDGERWYNIYELNYVAHNTGFCALLSYRYRSEIDEGVIIDEP